MEGTLHYLLRRSGPRRIEQPALTAYLTVVVLALLAAGSVEREGAMAGTLANTDIAGQSRPSVLAGPRRTNGLAFVGQSDTALSASDDERQDHTKTDGDALAERSPEFAARTTGQVRGKPTAGLMALDYTLPGTAERSAPIEPTRDGNITVSKPVLLGANTAGSISITIDSDARLLLESGELRALLEKQSNTEATVARLPESGLVSFNSLRNLGVDLRYNPTQDRIVIAQN